MLTDNFDCIIINRKLYFYFRKLRFRFMYFYLLYFISLCIYYVFISLFVWHFDNGELILVTCLRNVLFL